MFRLAPYRRPHRLDSMMPRVFGDWFNWPNWPEVSVQSFEVDVQESDQGYVLQANLPGVAKDNITLDVDNGYLTIGVRQDELRSEDQANYICRERRHISSQRSFYVGNIDPADVTASYRDGVLEVKFPKATGNGNGRRIPIQ